MVKDARGNITTEGFCELCEVTLPVIGGLGAGERALRQRCRRPASSPSPACRFVTSRSRRSSQLAAPDHPTTCRLPAVAREGLAAAGADPYGTAQRRWLAAHLLG